MNYLVVLLFFIGFINGTRRTGWNYDDFFPNIWRLLDDDQFSECKGSNKEQATINILSEFVRCDQTMLKPVELHGYNTSYSFNFSNTQRTIRGALQERTPAIEFKGSGLPVEQSTFELIQFHFHWTVEHVIENQRVPLELHLVHVSQLDPNYFAVIVIQFEIVNQTNSNFNSISSVARQLAQQPSTYFNTNVNLLSLFPSNFQNRYYFYESTSNKASLCKEKVYWTIMADKVEISEEQFGFLKLNQIHVNSTTKSKKAIAYNQHNVLTMDCDLATANKSTKKTINNFLLFFISLFLIQVFF